MLNEIIKGMSNAAEKIDENFQNGSIVEHNLDETEPLNGYYVRYGNGLQICFISNLNLEYESQSRLATNWNFPASFIGTPVLLPVQENSLGTEITRGGTFGTGAVSDYGHIRYFSPFGTTFGSSDQRIAHAVAIGHWE